MTGLRRLLVVTSILALGLLPVVGYSYGTVGHASQQLRLLASELIPPVLNSQALTVRVPELPYVILDTESQAFRRQLDVLVDEGMLEREAVVAEQRELTSQGWVTRNTAGVQYLPVTGQLQPTIRYGDAVLLRLGEITLDPQTGGDTQARISFSWQVDDLKEWVWAPVFDGDDRLNQIKASQESPIPGSANLVWDPQGQIWRLNGLVPFAGQ
ncbi:hypothetical protein [Saccharospirillum impatiens]|uniref:hypothetical protein n=1 Tax=Saccharospirillum impatiens TaxID=169438 RepID=UPI0004197BED|nr:hypothetical protein [Saccharospirillum impatiens]